MSTHWNLAWAHWNLQMILPSCSRCGKPKEMGVWCSCVPQKEIDRINAEIEAQSYSGSISEHVRKSSSEWPIGRSHDCKGYPWACDERCRIRMRDEGMFIEPQAEGDSANYLVARDYVVNLSKEDQTKLYHFMYHAYDHCRIYK